MSSDSRLSETTGDQDIRRKIHKFTCFSGAALREEVGPTAQPVTQQGDVLLQLGRVLQQGQWAGVDRLVFGTLGQTRAQQVGDGRVHRLLPALATGIREVREAMGWGSFFTNRNVGVRYVGRTDCVNVNDPFQR